MRVDALRRARRVEEEEDVEVRAVADLAAAELAHGEDREALHVLQRGRAEGVPGGGLELGVGERGEGVGGLPGAELAGEIGEAHLQRDVGLGAAEGADDGLVALAAGHLGDGDGDLGAGHLGGGGAAGEEDDVAELGVVGEGVADEGARAQRLDEAADAALLVAEELDVHARPLHPREEGAQVARGLLGVGGVDDGLEDGLGEALELLAGAAAEGRVGVARELEEIARDVGPALAERGRGLGGGGADEAGGAEDGVEEAVGIGALQRGDGVGEARGARLAPGHQRDEAGGDALHVPLDVGAEVRGPVEAERAGEAPLGGGRVGARVGLQPGGDLHGVLGAAQREVRLGDLPRLAVGDEARRRAAGAARRACCARAPAAPCRPR